MLILYAIAIFVGASLLFVVQPMVAKLLLPVLGGSPAVWNTCMVFFQAALLAGYAWAHVSVKWLGVRRQAWVHAGLVVLGLIALPIALPTSQPPPDASPIPWLLGVLAVAVGIPFVLVATGGPILQRWFAATGHKAAADPYFLYAASNAGSLLALIAYPLVIEPNLTLAQQRDWWRWGYLAFAALVALCAGSVMRSKAAPPAPSAATTDTSAPSRHGWRWRGTIILLAFVPSSLMLGVTQYLTTDIASMPLLWVLPLAIYLLTFILAFAKRRFVSVRGLSLLAAICITGLAIGFLAHGQRLPISAMLVVHGFTLLVLGLLCHTRAADLRPSTDRLTEFYLLLSVGGVLGGSFNALAAPLLFNSILEYPIILAVACLCRVVPPIRSAWAERIFWGGNQALRVGALILGPIVAASLVWFLIPKSYGFAEGSIWFGIALAAGPAAMYLFSSRSRLGFAAAFLACVLVGNVVYNRSSQIAYRERTFFGVHKINQSSNVTELVHSTTIHGMQFRKEPDSRTPLSYYHPQGPLGDVIAAYNHTPLFDRMGLVGMGSGAIAGYGRPGQEIVFHEIDPAVQGLSDKGWFTYVRDSNATVRVVLGDGRRTMQSAPEGTYGLIVLDAFSSDAIPVHLLTREAMQTYLRALKPGGVLAVHVSNHYMDLGPVVGRIAEDLRLEAIRKYDSAETSERYETGRLSSDWVLLARDTATLQPIRARGGWDTLKPEATTPLWTDEFSNVWSVITWK